MNKTTRLLVVDDDPSILQICSYLLSADGIEVRGAVNGGQGLAMARDHPPDMVLVDVGLPDLTGTEVCRIIKADPVLSDTLVVLFSGSATNPLDKVRGLEIGADDYLLKSGDWNEIRARIRTLLRLRDTAAALRFSEQHYRRLVEILPDAIAVFELGGRLTAINPQAVLMMGYGSHVELIGKAIFDLISSEDHECVRLDIAIGLETGLVRNREYTALRKNGERFPVELSVAVLKDAREQPFALVSVIRDVTQRRQAGQQLRLLADAVRSTRDIIFITDNNNCFTFVNQAFQEAYGFTGEEIFGKPPDLLWSVNNPQSLQDRIKKKTTQGGWRGEVLHVRKDGNEFPVSLTTSPIRSRDGDVLNLVYVARDISDRKRVQKELEESRRRQKAILDNIADPAWLKDAEGRFLAGNEPLARLFSRPLAAVIGRTAFDFMPKEEATRLTEDDHKVIRTGRPVTVEERVTGHHYRAIWFETLKSPIFNSLHQVVGTAGIARDITARKRAEALLQRQRDFAIFLAATNDLKTALRQLVELAMSLEGVDCGWVYWVEPESGTLTLEAHEGLSPDFVKRISHFAPDSEQAMMLKVVALSADHASDFWARFREELRRENLMAVEVIPVRHDGEIVALLNLGAHTVSEIPLRSRLAIETTVAQVGGAIARIRTEQSLRASRELLEKTIHSLHAAVMLLDAEALTIQECNPAASRIFGYGVAEIIGRNIATLQVDDRTFGEFKTHLLAASKTEGVPGEFDLRMKRKSGTVFQTIQSLAPIRDPAGRLGGWVSVVHDITARALAEAELRQLPQRIIEAQEAEQLRVARDLHDSVNQVIASVKMRLRNVGERLAQTDPAAHEILSRCEKLLVQAIAENRRIAHNLRPSDLDEFGLAVAFRNFCNDFQSRSDLKVEHRISRINWRLAPAVELNLFRILQESVNNVEKHAGAKTVRLHLSFAKKAVTLLIQDDGRGIRIRKSTASKRDRRGIGLTNMQQRAALIGGMLSVMSNRKRGTVVTVVVPAENTLGR